MRSESQGSPPRRLSAVPTQRQDAASGPSRSSDDGDGGSGPRPPLKRRTRYTARAAVLLLVLCALVLALAYPLQQYFSQGSQIDKLKKQNAQKRAQVDQLRQELEHWQDPDYVRIQARSRLHYVLPGETGLRLLGSSDAAAGLPNPTTTPSGGPSAWYSQLWSSVTAAASPVPSTSPSPSPSPGPTPSTSPGESTPTTTSTPKH
ncbi:MAG: septum formation initiator family protein [Catenulisporales bacterium]|nr:septum formation initiator family protein [Catenulisporales bacterium]